MQKLKALCAILFYFQQISYNNILNFFHSPLTQRNSLFENSRQIILIQKLLKSSSSGQIGLFSFGTSSCFEFNGFNFIKDRINNYYYHDGKI